MNIRAGSDVEGPGRGHGRRIAGVVQGRVECEGSGNSRRGLPVRCLRLNEGDVKSLCVDNVILIECVVFGG